MTEQELANVIWDIKEIIRNCYDDAEVEDVILPFMLLRRLDCVLEDHHKEVMDILDKVDEKMRPMKLQAEMKKRHLAFFNSSSFTLKALLANANGIVDNFKTYLDGFTENIKDILLNFVKEDTDNNTNKEDVDLSKIYSRLARANKLFAVTQLISQVDLSPKNVTNAQMGTVFEIVVRRSKESTKTKAGQFYTPREIVRLLVSLTMCGKEPELTQTGRMFSIYDPCCGTGGMLTVGEEYLKEMSGNPDLKVYLYGQELSQKTYAICKSDLLLKGDTQNLDKQIYQGDTLADDKLVGKKFNFMLANPPFGVDWGKDSSVKNAVEKDNAPGKRFAAGLPDTSDGSLLFLMHMISKMDAEGSRIGCVLNGSPLFNGGAGGGWSNIRKSFLDANLLDAIVALPKNLFYGTDITTYLWILDNKRPEERRNKVLFINANHAEYVNLLQKSLGKKRFEISGSGAANILELYKNYVTAKAVIKDEETEAMEEIEVAKLMDYDDFFYTQVTVDRPLRLKFSKFADKYKAYSEDLEKIEDKLPETLKKQLELLKQVSKIDGIENKETDKDVFESIKEAGIKTTTADITVIRKVYAETCEDMPEVHKNPLKADSPLVMDSNLRDTERIPKKEDIQTYFEREVLPFAPDAVMDRSKDKIGCEFPFTKLFYHYHPLRDTKYILEDLIKSSEDTLMIEDLFKEE